jgi:hypothetical protein
MTSRHLVIATLVSVLSLQPLQAQQAVANSADQWRAYAGTLPPNTYIQVGLTDGTRVTGNFVEVSSDALRVRLKTRLTVQDRDLPLVNITSIEPRKPGSSAGMKVVKVAMWSGIAIGAVLGIAWLKYRSWGGD